MKVPLTLRDHLDRAVSVYPDRVWLVDEPDQPAPPLPDVTYRRLGEMAVCAGRPPRRLRRAVRRSRRDGVAQRGALSPCQFLRCLGQWPRIRTHQLRCRVTSRVHRRALAVAECLLVDPEVNDSLSSVSCAHRFVIGTEKRRGDAAFRCEPRPWTPDEDVTATINYTSGHDRRDRKGVEQTHRACG
jgi:hypothetical protein